MTMEQALEFMRGLLKGGSQYYSVREKEPPTVFPGSLDIVVELKVQGEVMRALVVASSEHDFETEGEPFLRQAGFSAFLKLGHDMEQVISRKRQQASKNN